MTQAYAMAKAVSALKAALDYAKRDQRAKYALPGEVSVSLRSRRLARLLPEGFNYTTRDGSLTVTRLGPENVRLTAHPFPAESGLWNGPDAIPNKWFRSMLASLFHDLIWGHADELAAAIGKSRVEVLRWGNDALYLLWVWASDDSWLGRREAWLAFQATQFAAPWYHKIKRLLGAFLLATLLVFAAGCSEGCYSLPDGGVTDVTGAEIIHSVIETQGDGL